MKTISFILLALTTLFSAPEQLFKSPLTSVSQAEISRMGKAMASQKTVKVSFVQTKSMAALKKPLIAEGTLLFSQGRAILWHQKYPYDELIILRPDGTIRFRDPSGKESVQKAGTDRINAMMTTLFEGNIAELQRLFSLFFIAGKSEWHLGLIPKKAAMKKGIEKMELTCGHNGIMKAITMVGPGGTTSIAFEPTPSQKPTASEEVILAQP